MSKYRRYEYDGGLFLNSFRNILDDMMYGFNYFPSVSTTTFTGQLVDTEKYDIVPRPEYQAELLKQTESKIEALDKDYKEQRKRLVEEKENLTKALKQKND